MCMIVYYIVEYIITLYPLRPLPYTFALVIMITPNNRGKGFTDVLTQNLFVEPSKNINMTKEEIKKVTDLVTDNTLFTTKEVLTSDEAARYMGISKSYLYKLTMRQQIPHYKPMGKMCYFNRVEIENWLQGNRVATEMELQERAKNYCMKGGAR